MMIRLAGLLRGVGLGVSLSIAAAAAAAPPVLDRVPTDALVVVAAPSIDRLSKSMDTLTTSLKLPMPIPGLKDMLSKGGIEKGLDTAKSMAVVVLAPPAEAKDDKNAKKKKGAEADDDDDVTPPPTVFLLPATDYAALLGNFHVKPGAAGAIDSVEVSGNTMFIKSVGDGYAAMSESKDTLAGFAGKSGNAKAHEAALGKTCGAIADASDVVVIANFPAINEKAGGLIKSHLHKAMEESPMAMAEGAEDQMKAMEAMLDTVMSQSRVGVAGVRVDASGVALDMGAQFNDGSELAKVFAKPGNASSLIKKLPKQDYLFAFASDMSDPAMKEWTKKLNPAGAKAKDADQEALMKAVTGPMDKATGMAVSIGASPAALMGGGLFTNTVVYTATPDPEGYIKASAESFKGMNDKTINGIQFATTYGEGASKAGDTPVDTWTLKITPDEDGNPMVGQMLMGLFGPNGGPSGYVAKAEGGVIRTLGKNSLLMTAAMDAAKGTNSMSADTLTAQVGEKLPPGRSFEGYMGIKSFLDMAKPMLAMMGGGGDEPEFPDVIPPVGLGFGGADGAARSTLYVPMPVIKAVATVVQSVQAGGMGGGGPGPRPKKKDGGAGQPKF